MSSANGFRIIAWSFLLIIKGDVARGQFPGTNAVALINGQTMLDCLTTVLPDSWWRHTSDGTNNSSTIATGCIVIGNNAAYYRTEPIGGNTCRLTIGNVTMQLGGVYNCFDGNAIIYRNLVTVIDPNASVVVYNQSEIVEDDKLNISCSISYNGPASPAPSLHPSPYWITSPGQIYTSQTYTTAANVVTLVATLTVQRPTVPIFWCNTDFEITEHSGAYNATAPADNFTVGNTTALDVRYGPTQPVIANRSEVITINGVACGISVLNCSSTGNPIPNYRWYDSDVILSTGETLTLGEINRNYTCQAYNKIRNYTNVSSTTYRILVADCNSTVECCVYPRDDTTSITVEGCDNGTLCDCSQGSSGIKLVCSAKTFPNASYIWNGPNGQVGHSPVYDQIKMNGTYQCHAYFDRTLSNYSGDVIFSNGSKEKTVDQCCELCVVVIAFIVPYLGCNVISLVVFMVVYSKHKSFKDMVNGRFSEHTVPKIVLFVSTSVCFGLIVIPCVITIAWRSNRVKDGKETNQELTQRGETDGKETNQDLTEGGETDGKETNQDLTEGGETDGKETNQDLTKCGETGIPLWAIVVIWSVHIVFLFPTAFVVVFFVYCKQMTFEIS